MTSRGVSPVGIAALQNLLALGASGALRQKVLREKSDAQRMQELEKTKDLAKSAEIKSAYGIFFDIKAHPSAELYAKVQKLAAIAVADFTGEPVKSADDLNRWVENESGLVNVFNASDVQYALLIAAHALWFKDSWKEPFNKALTQPDQFYKANGSVIQQDFMQRTDSMHCFVGKAVQAVQLPFVNGASAEFVLGLGANEEFDLSKRFDYTSRRVELHLPKFTGVFNNDLKDLPILREARSPGNLNAWVGNPAAVVSEARQLLHLSFDEEGAEVKALTYVTMRATAIMPERVIVMNFNRPFHYRILKDGLELVRGFYTG